MGDFSCILKNLLPAGNLEICTESIFKGITIQMFKLYNNSILIARKILFDR